MAKHGIFIQEDPTAITAPREATAGLQVVIGTAPVNMAEDPAAVVNVPVLATNATEAMAALGYIPDYKNYTLCQSMYIQANMYQVSPVVYINVLDPSKHKKTLEEQTVAVTDLQAVVEKTGVLKDGLTVKKADGETALSEGTDYTLSFTTEGFLAITLIAEGQGAEEESLKVSGNQLDPSLVKETDIIGAYDPATGKETGAEVIRQVYPKLGVVPGIIIAPGYSKIPAVGIALMAKAANINGVFKAMAYLDIDTTKAKKYTDVKEIKEKSGFTSEFAYNLWPCVKVGDSIFSYSAVAAARTAYNDADNDDVPSASPSNKALTITGTCLEDGTEVVLDQDQATTVGEYGVATAVNINGFRIWGNHTGAYPASGDAKDIWINVRRMFNWQGNSFILTYFDKVDDPMNYVLIENIVDSENIRCAAYAPAHWAGATIEYLEADNPITDILAGKMTFRQHIAPYTPAETITNILNYDTAMLQAALTGGE